MNIPSDVTDGNISGRRYQITGSIADDAIVIRLFGAM